MYQANGTYYTEDHSVSFGDLVTRTSGGNTTVEFEDIANTWSDWHLIPSSRPSVAHPSIVTRFVEVPGADGMLDLTTFLTGRPNYGQRQGNLQFIVDNDHENWETIRMKIANTLHGKRLKMRLMDDPGYYYEGRFTVGNWEPGSDHSRIQITYNLEPYKLRITGEGSTPTLWDPFNFETDYDYYTMLGSPISVSNQTKTFYIHAGEYPFTPTATWVSGSVTVSFGGVSRTMSMAGSYTLGKASSGQNTLTVSGNGSIIVTWRGGAL